MFYLNFNESKSCFYVQSPMVKSVKNKLLYNLYFLKSLGYNYHENIMFSSKNNSLLSLPDDIALLEIIAQNCHLCDLSKYRTHVLFGYGKVNSKIMFIGDEPSMLENTSGDFLVGKNGEMLIKMIENVIKIKVSDTYVTNIVKCKTSNTKIDNDVVNCCSGFLNKQIELVNPKLVVILGEKAYSHLFDDNISFNQIRGQVIMKNGFDVIATFHPSYLLRNPSLKKEAYYDMLKIKSFLEKQ